MAKKRKRKTRGKRPRPAGRSASSSAVMVAERIAVAGPNYIEENFIRIMQGGARLRQEPEFADLYFEPRPTLEATAQNFPRFKRRFVRAARQGTKAGTLAYDDYRIAVLDDLDTPQLRDQLRRRLDRCTERLKHSHDADKIEMALFFSVLLGDKGSKIIKGKEPLPLGVYSLVTTIYEESFDRAMAEIPNARDIVGDEVYSLWCAKHSKEDMKVISATVEQIADNKHPNAFEDLALRIETDPDLAAAWRRQEEYLIEELQSQFTQGGLTFDPSLFTPDEVALAMARMERRYLSRPWSLSRYVTLAAMFNFTRCVRETLDEIMSPQRMAGMIAAFKAAGQKSLESDDEQLRALVPHIQAAIHNMQREQTPARNKIVGTMFLLGFLTTLGDQGALSPRWRRLVERLKKSRVLQRMGETDRL